MLENLVLDNKSVDVNKRELDEKISLLQDIIRSEAEVGEIATFAVCLFLLGSSEEYSINLEKCRRRNELWANENKDNKNVKDC